jgi:hypothetical protein
MRNTLIDRKYIDQGSYFKVKEDADKNKLFQAIKDEINNVLRQAKRDL